MKQDTNGRLITSRCYKPTRYYADCDKHEITKTPTLVDHCIYLKNGNCTIKTCVRRNYDYEG